MLTSILFLSAIISTAWGCPKHDNYQSHPHLGRRQVRIDVGREPKDWNYDVSADWATIKPGKSPFPFDRLRCSSFCRIPSLPIWNSPVPHQHRGEGTGTTPPAQLRGLQERILAGKLLQLAVRTGLHIPPPGTRSEQLAPFHVR